VKKFLVGVAYVSGKTRKVQIFVEVTVRVGEEMFN
jgi:hypothetical protein